MKKSKKLVFVTMLLLFVLTVMPASAAKKPSADTVKRAYTDFVISKAPNRNLSHGMGYADLNGDGVNEMFYYHQWGVRARTYLYTYKNDKVKLVKDFGAGTSFFGFDKKNKKFGIFESSGAADGRLVIYKYNGKSLKTLVYYKSQSSYKNGKFSVKFYKNKKKITEKAYNKVINQTSKWAGLSH